MNRQAKLDRAASSLANSLGWEHYHAIKEALRLVAEASDSYDVYGVESNHGRSKKNG